MKARCFGGPADGREFDVRDDLYNLEVPDGPHDRVMYARVSSIPGLPYAVFVYPFTERVFFQRCALDSLMLEHAPADVVAYTRARLSAGLRLLISRDGRRLRGEPVVEQVPGTRVPNTTEFVAFALTDPEPS